MKPDPQERPDFEKAAEIWTTIANEEALQFKITERKAAGAHIEDNGRSEYALAWRQSWDWAKKTFAIPDKAAIHGYDLSRKRIEELEKQLHELLNDFDELSKKASKRIEELEEKEDCNKRTILSFQQEKGELKARIEELEAEIKRLKSNPFSGNPAFH